MDQYEFRASLANRDLTGLDSEFSYSTRRLIELFNADGAHLNKWWVMTPTDWICPSCKRKKSQIVRLNKNNYLTCQLHEHHDHMKEAVKSLFESYSTNKDLVVADEYSERFAIKAAFSLSAYDNTVICFDCNKVDADAKKIVKAHHFFSFSPREIAQFVKATPNKEHQINELRARQVWERVEPVFHTRMEMAQKFAMIAAEKQDWYQRSESTAKQIENHAKYLFQYHGLLEIEKYEPERLLYNTEPFKGENSSWRKKKNPLVKKRPSPNEMSHLIATRGKYWNKYNDNWVCPCCSRKKYDCVRPSKQNPWVLEIKSVPLFLDDKMEVSPRTESMCADCIDTAINLGREILKESDLRIEYPSSVITFTELSNIILPRPHSKHEFKNELIDSMISEIVTRLLNFLEKKKNV